MLDLQLLFVLAVSLLTVNLLCARRFIINHL